MARLARVVVPGYPHHVIQRGNRRQQTFFEKGDYQAVARILAALEATGEAGKTGPGPPVFPWDLPRICLSRMRCIFVPALYSFELAAYFSRFPLPRDR